MLFYFINVPENIQTVWIFDFWHHRRRIKTDTSKNRKEFNKKNVVYGMLGCVLIQMYLNEYQKWKSFPGLLLQMLICQLTKYEKQRYFDVLSIHVLLSLLYSLLFFIILSPPWKMKL